MFKINTHRSFKKMIFDLNLMSSSHGRTRRDIRRILQFKPYSVRADIYANVCLGITLPDILDSTGPQYLSSSRNILTQKDQFRKVEINMLKERCIQLCSQENLEAKLSFLRKRQSLQGQQRQIILSLITTHSEQ